MAELLQEESTIRTETMRWLWRVPLAIHVTHGTGMSLQRKAGVTGEHGRRPGHRMIVRERRKTTRRDLRDITCDVCTETQTE